MKKENWEERFRIKFQLRPKAMSDKFFCDVLIDFIRQEKAKDRQRFIEMLKGINDFVIAESGKSGRKEILEKIQEAINRLGFMG